MLLCVTAMAAGTGITDATSAKENVTVTVAEGNEKMDVTLPSTTGAQYLVLALSDATAIPTENNIVYIDQTAATDSTVTFTVYPSNLVNGTTYHIYITSDTDSKYSVMTEVATFKCSVDDVTYTLGDIDNDGDFNATDARFTLQMAVGKGSWTESQRLAADVDHDNNINATDARLILQAAVGKYVIS